MDKVEEVLSRVVEEIFPNKASLEKLMCSKKIRVYLGVDPTGIKLHLGHSIPLRKLQEFASLGHKAILLFGTGTVLAGDPSQRGKTRLKITRKQIAENIKTWKEQAAKIIDFDKVQIKYNGDWLLKLTYTNIINIASNISSVQLFKRDMFRERIERGDTVWAHETLYPLFQGYDSVVMDVDLEIGGTDQTFNMLIGRELQKKMANRNKYVLATPLISGTDGKPMSKTSENCIWLTDTASEMFGKLMSINDNQIETYWKLLTNLPEADLNKNKPMDTKKRLASEIVRTYHDKNAAQKAQSEFENIFQKRLKPKGVSQIKIERSQWDIIDFLIEQGLTSSRSEAKRLLDQGAIEIGGQVFKDHQVEFKDGQILRVGKKKFVRIEVR